MTVTLHGCMENGLAGWKPVWIDPCSGLNMPGCMEEASAGWFPRLIGGFGTCRDNKDGCMELVGENYRPVLVYDEYADTAALEAACCPDCSPCWQGGGEFVPIFVEVTFSGLTVCPFVPNCNGNPGGTPPLDGTYVLEFTNVPGSEVCAWCYADGANPETFVVLKLTFSGGNHFLELYYSYCGPTTCGETGPHLMFADSFVTTDCLETSFTNLYGVGTCNVSIAAAQNRAYGGSASVDWNP